MLVENKLLDDVITIARNAGEKILTIYHQSSALEITSKTDDSPLTQADLAAHHIIVAALNRLTPKIPVLSEESSLPNFAERQQWAQYWLVDPLDGTKEFISRNGEFTVNIALIDSGMPVLGVVYVPVGDVCYAGFSAETASESSSKITVKLSDHGSDAASNISLSTQKTPYVDKNIHKYACKISANGIVDIKVRSPQRQVSAGLPIDVVASRHHRADAIDTLCAKINTDWGQTCLRSMGSSLKLCLVAEGGADLYPRFGPTSEWDTAAAQAIVEAAGGHVLNAAGLPLRYNQKDSMRNPEFFVIGDDIAQWRRLLFAC
jgi:3'(2'), 5'-bisphosphate nucleotidase